VQLAVFGANTRQLSATTDVNGTATFSYLGTNAGTDTVTATAIVSGLLTASNAVPIQWTIPAPGGPIPGATGPAPPSVVISTPADGAAVSQPVAVTATIRAPPSSPINSWSLQYQNVSGGSPVTLGSGTSNPPSALGTFDPTGLAAGTYAITVTATTSAGGGATAVARVIVGNGGGTAAQAPPTISASSPADGAIVSRPVPVTAAIAPPSGQTIASWSVTYQALDVEPVVTLASGTGTPPSTLGTFDPTLLPNDIYAITITATASGGGTQTLTTTVAVFGSLKLGRYVTTYQDLSVPVNGFQMQVRRTYDSFDKRVGDFGIGWHVGLTNFRVSANRQLGAGGWSEYPTLCIFGLCFYAFKTSAPHYVTVTFPDQHMEIFDFTPQGGAGILYWQGSAAFTARPGTGTTSTLEVSGDSSLSYDFAGNLGNGSGYYNPTRFKLTTHDGRVLVLDTVSGLISETDRNGNSLSVDAGGVHASNGQSLTYNRDANGRITSIAGPSGQSLAYTYSSAGDLASSTDPRGSVSTYSYDANHDLLKSTGPAGPLQSLQYDSAGRLSAVTDALGHTTSIASNVAGQQQIVVDALGTLTSVLTYDDLGDVVRRDLAASGKTLTSTYQFDSIGHLLKATDPLGHSGSFTYDSAGDVLQSTDALGNTSKFTYDSSGHLLSAIAPDGTTLETLSYDANENLTAITRSDGATLSYTYDSAGRIISAADFRGKSQTMSYDALGHVAATTDPLGNTTRFTADASGRITSLTDPLGAVTKITYDADGNRTSTTDGLGHSQSVSYDGQDRVTSATDQLGHVSSIAYDAVGNLASVTNRDGKVATFTYDADGRLTAEALPGNDTTTYSYDPLGEVLSAGNANSILNFTYDAAGRLTAQGTAPTATSPQPSTTLTYAYDAADRLASGAGPDGTIAYGYDGNSRLSSFDRPGGRDLSLQLRRRLAFDGAEPPERRQRRPRL